MTAELTTEQGVKNYLKGTRFASRQIATLSGGNANFAYRAELVEPYLGRKTAIVKHGQPYIRCNANVPFDISRQVLVIIHYEIERLSDFPIFRTLK